MGRGSSEEMGKFYQTLELLWYLPESQRRDIAYRESVDTRLRYNPRVRSLWNTGSEVPEPRSENAHPVRAA